jgi:hypothetical protein
MRRMYERADKWYAVTRTIRLRGGYRVWFLTSKTGPSPFSFAFDLTIGKRMVSIFRVETPEGQRSTR